MLTHQIRIPFENESLSSQKPVPQTLQTVFESISTRLSPSNSEENKFLRMRNLLGKASEGLSEQQIEALIINFQYLIDTWLDEYERQILGGKLLKEVLNEEV